MTDIHHHIVHRSTTGQKQLAVLIDPDKMVESDVPQFIEKVNSSQATHIFLGGSKVKDGATQRLAKIIKLHTRLPLVLFPGDHNQLTDEADGILLLSLISGRNSDYLIGKHIEAVPQLNKMHLEIVPTGYILIENGKKTAVEHISQTKPLSKENINYIVDTAKAGEYLGMKLIYLEAGSGALHPVNPIIISSVKAQIEIPIIVGGGIRSKKELEEAYDAGADLVVIGTAFEQDISFFNHISKSKPKQTWTSQ